MAATYTTAKIGSQTITGAGDDIIDGADNKKADIFAGSGTNLIRTGRKDDIIEAGDGNDFVDAGDGNNSVSAGKGNNAILTGGGKDFIEVGLGNSYVSSGEGNDTIKALLGGSVINAGIGNDRVTIGGGNNKIVLEGGFGSVSITGFDIAKDKLRLGESLLGKTLTFETKGADTLVMAGTDLVATLKGVASGSAALIDTAPLLQYEATELKSFTAATVNPNLNVNAAAINDFGQIAGRLDTTGTFTNQNETTFVINGANVIRQGFVWDKGVLSALNSIGTKKGSSDFGAKNGETVNMLTPNVNTLSNRGVILGTGDEVRIPIGLPTDRALQWEPVAVKGKADNYGKLIINDFGGIESYFFDTNNAKQIVGRNIVGTDKKTPEGDGINFDIPVFFESDGKRTDLKTLGGEGGTARGINNKGQIVGVLDSDGKLDDTSTNTAALWEKDGKGFKLTDLGTFGAKQASLRDINDSGSIIGQISNGETTAALQETSAFILRDKDGNGKYAADEYTNLGSLGGKTGTANGINSFGVVVGTSQTKVLGGADGKTVESHAFVWSEGKMTDLNSLLTAPLLYNGAKVVLTSAVGINNFGDIVALGASIFKNPTSGKDALVTRSYSLKGIAAKVVAGAAAAATGVAAAASPVAAALAAPAAPVVAAGNSVVAPVPTVVTPVAGITSMDTANMMAPADPMLVAPVIPAVAPIG
jgi:probable HAF family extracellular repeat protein